MALGREVGCCYACRVCGEGSSLSLGTELLEKLVGLGRVKTSGAYFPTWTSLKSGALPLIASLTFPRVPASMARTEPDPQLLTLGITEATLTSVDELLGTQRLVKKIFIEPPRRGTSCPTRARPWSPIGFDGG